MDAFGEVFRDLKEGSVIGGLNGMKHKSKTTVYQQAENTQYNTDHHWAVAIDPVTEFFPHPAAEPYSDEKDTGNKHCQKIGFVGEIPDRLKRKRQDQQNQKDCQDCLLEHVSYRCCQAPIVLLLPEIKHISMRMIIHCSAN